MSIENSSIEAFRTADAGDIVIPAGKLDHDKYELLKQTLGAVGIDTVTVAGSDININPEPEVDISWVDTEVESWKDQFSESIDPKYLEEIVQVDSTGTLQYRQTLTRETLRKAFIDIYEPNRSTLISFGSFYNKTVNSILLLRDKRRYVSEGTAYLGERYRPGYRFPDQLWSITPEALHGLVIDPGNVRLPQWGSPVMGDKIKARADHMLSVLSNAPQTTSIRNSGWLGHERAQSVGR
jgi:hypothetical protein